MSLAKSNLTFYSIPEIEGVDAVEARRGSNVFPRHVHGVYVVVVLLEGSRELTRGKTKYLVHAGQHYILNPYEAHTCAPVGGMPCSYLALCVSEERMRGVSSQLMEESDTLPHFDAPPCHIPEIHSAMGSFFELLAKESDTFELESALLPLLVALIEQCGNCCTPLLNARDAHDAVGSIKAFLEQNFAGRITLEDIGNAVHLSPYHCQHVFVRETGLSPHDWLVRVRIREACRMLGVGFPAVEVAAATGFNDQSHFSRIFRRAVGTTPGGYVAGRLSGAASRR